MTITAKQFGFSNNEGVLSNIVDGDLTTFWSPLQNDFSGYPDQFFAGDPGAHVLNFGPAFPALEFDFGEAVNVNQIFIKVQDSLTLGPAVLIGSDNPASSTADTLQSSDVFLAFYPQEQICTNVFLDVQAMLDNPNLKKRYLRLLQRSSLGTVKQPSPGPANSFTDDMDGAKHWNVVSYASQLTIEVWGGGSSGGLSGDAQSGGDSSVSKSGWSTTLAAGGGQKSTATTPDLTTGGGAGGTASGGNTDNIPGNPGSATASDLTGSGGGPVTGRTVLGPGIPMTDPPTGGAQVGFFLGVNGEPPGGGGGGRGFWTPGVGLPPTSTKFPGGGSGGYVRRIIARSSGDADPGSTIDYVVGKGGKSSVGDGLGANGRVRFSWV